MVRSMRAAGRGARPSGLALRAGAALLVPLAFAGTCLACAPAAALASEAAADGGALAAASAGQAAAGQAEAYSGGELTFAGLKASVPEGLQARVAGSMVALVNDEGTLAVSAQDLSAADLDAEQQAGAAPETAEDRAQRLHEAFAAAAATSAQSYSVGDVEDLGTLDLGGGATACLFRFQESGPYVVTQGEGGTTVTQPVGAEGHWTVEQAYVALADGGFALVQAAWSQTASEEDAAAAQGVIGSLALAAGGAAQAAGGASTDAASAGAAGQASAAQAAGGTAAAVAPAGAAAVPAGQEAGAAESVPEGQLAQGFTFQAPEGLACKGGMWVGTADNVMVEWLGALVASADAQGFDDAAAQAAFEDVAAEMGATLEGTALRATASGAQVRVGALSFAQGGGTYEALLVLVPVADGSVEGLYAICDAQASTAWADKLAQMVDSIQVKAAVTEAGASAASSQAAASAASA